MNQAIDSKQPFRAPMMDEGTSCEVPVVSLGIKSNEEQPEDRECSEQGLYSEYGRAQGSSTGQSEDSNSKVQVEEHLLVDDMYGNDGGNSMRSEIVASEMEIPPMETGFGNDGNDASLVANEEVPFETEPLETGLQNEDDDSFDAGENVASEIKDSQLEVDFGEDDNDVIIRDHEIEVGAYEEVLANNNDEMSVGTSTDFSRFVISRNKQERTDRTIYTDMASLQSVPLFACGCHRCYSDFCNVPFIARYVDENQNITMTTAGMSEICKSTGRRVVRFPDMVRFEDRLISYEKEEFNRKMWPPSLELAEAGFFFHGMKILCFNCHLEFRTLHHCCNPLREHARWFPCCPFVEDKMKKEEIHAILQDTKKMVEEMASRTETMDMGMMMDLLHQGYVQKVVRQAISASFFDISGFPDYKQVVEKINFIQNTEE